MCEHSIDYSCDNMNASDGAGTAYNGRMTNFDNSMNTFKMRPYDPLELAAVTIYEEPDCKGTGGTLF